MFQRVLVAIHDSQPSDRQLEAAAGFARAFEARLTLLAAFNWAERFAMVEAPTIEIAKDERRVEEERARSFLEERANELREGGLTVDTVVIDAPPAQAILEEAGREPGTLVVLAAHDRGWLARLVKGSTLQEVLQDFHVPVLIIREGA